MSTDKDSFDEASEETEEFLEEFTSDPDCMSKRRDLIPPYLKTEMQLFEHQKVAITWCLEAEGGKPIVNNAGEKFYSRSGTVCLPTGTGKTVIMVGLSNFDVGKAHMKSLITTTSLNLISLNPIERENISCTVICVDSKILKTAWISDLDKFYNTSLSFYYYETESKLLNDLPKYPQVMTSPEYMKYAEVYGRYTEVKKWTEYIYSMYKAGSFTTQQFEEYFTKLGYPDQRTNHTASKIINVIQEELDEAEYDFKIYFLAYVMSTIKIFFVPNTCFYTLFPFFKKYTVSRLILDEPQNTTYTKQDLFRDYIKNPRLKRLKRAGKTVEYSEESPARFIWYVSATPNLIADNKKDHYFNSWINKNDLILEDYLNSIRGEGMFPELTKRYIVKIPYSVILKSARPDFDSLIKEYVVTSRRSALSNVLKGALGDEFDNMLENDDYSGIIKKLALGGTVNDILEKSIERLRLDIQKDKVAISNYATATPKHIIEKSNDELRKKEENLAKLERKISTFRGNGGEYEECSICYEEMHFIPQSGDSADKSIVSHTKCLNCFHIGCLKPVLTSSRKCPICRDDLTDENVIPVTTSLENRKYNASRMMQDQFWWNPNKIYDSKHDSLKSCLSNMERYNQFGTLENQYRMKVLLFVEYSSGESDEFDAIVRLCQQAKFNVRLPFNRFGTVGAFKTHYPPIGGFEVKHPRAKKDFAKDVEEFKNANQRTLWIFRSGKESAGLNFPFVDTLIEYSRFKAHKQIIGRVKRLNRTIPVDIIRLRYASESEIANYVEPDEITELSENVENIKV